MVFDNMMLSLDYAALIPDPVNFIKKPLSQLPFQFVKNGISLKMYNPFVYIFLPSFLLYKYIWMKVIAYSNLAWSKFNNTLLGCFLGGVF